MKAEQVQIQRKQIVAVNTKLDEITRLLNILLEKAEKEEPTLEKGLIKKIAKEWKSIDAGKIKLHHYNSLGAFEKAIS